MFFFFTKQPFPVFTARDTERCSITGAHFYLASSRDLYRELIHWLGCNETVSRGLTQGFTPSNTISTLCSPIPFTLERFNLHILYPALLISNRKENNVLSFSFLFSSWRGPSSFLACIKQNFWILHIRSERKPDHNCVLHYRNWKTLLLAFKLGFVHKFIPATLKQVSSCPRLL